MLRRQQDSKGKSADGVLRGRRGGQKGSWGEKLIDGGEKFLISNKKALVWERGKKNFCASSRWQPLHNFCCWVRLLNAAIFCIPGDWKKGKKKKFLDLVWYAFIWLKRLFSHFLVQCFF